MRKLINIAKIIFTDLSSVCTIISLLIILFVFIAPNSNLLIIIKLTMVLGVLPLLAWIIFYEEIGK